MDSTAEFAQQAAGPKISGPTATRGRAKAFEDYLDKQAQQLDEKVRVHDQLAAHDLYDQLRSHGYTEVTILRGDGIWVDEADGRPLSINDTADEVFLEWLDDYGLGPAERLLNEQGSTQDLTQQPYGVARDQVGAQRDQIMAEAGLTGPLVRQEEGFAEVAAGTRLVLEQQFFDQEITEVTEGEETRFGVGEPTATGNAALVFRLDHTEHTVEVWDGTTNANSKHAAGHASVSDWSVSFDPPSELIETITNAAAAYKHLVYPDRAEQMTAEEIHTINTTAGPAQPARGPGPELG